MCIGRKIKHWSAPWLDQLWKQLLRMTDNPWWRMGGVVHNCLHHEHVKQDKIYPSGSLSIRLVHSVCPCLLFLLNTNNEKNQKRLFIYLFVRLRFSPQSQSWPFTSLHLLECYWTVITISVLQCFILTVMFIEIMLA